MLHKLMSMTAASALCLAGTAPLRAQDYRPAGFDAPTGATAAVNLRVPLGGRSERRRPTLGLTFAYGWPAGGAALDGRPAIRQIRLADLRFDRAGLDRVELASFDLANLDRDRRLNIIGGHSKDVVFILAMLIAGVTTVAILEATADDDPTPESDDEDGNAAPGG